MENHETKVTVSDYSYDRIDESDCRNIYVIGDVPGCRAELEALVEKLDPGPDELLVFVGDLTGKGSDGRGVVRLIRKMPNAVNIEGNNEPKLFRGEASSPELDDVDREYLGATERTHTAIRNTRNPKADTDYGRPFWWEDSEGPPRIFFGHTPLEDPIAREYAVGLDTSCVYGGSLTAYNCGRDEFVSVPARETYIGRDGERIVSPKVVPTQKRQAND